MAETESMHPGGQHRLDRRRLMRYLLGFSIVSTLAGVLAPILGYIWPPKRSAAAGGIRLKVAALIDIAPGQGQVLPMGEQPIILVRSKEGSVRAFSAVCPHLGCIVEWDETRQFILCPCHDARFNAQTGAVIAGPSPGPLPPVTSAVEDGNVYVGGA